MFRLTRQDEKGLSDTNKFSLLWRVKHYFNNSGYDLNSIFKANFVFITKLSSSNL